MVGHSETLWFPSRPRDSTMRLDTIALVDQESNRARALIRVPSGALIPT